MNMVARKIRRNAADVRVARLPDDRAVVGCALTALAALLLMLLTGTAKAEQLEFGIATQTSSAIAPHYFPGNTKYTPVKMIRIGK
jgi:hypothetical protein